MTTLSGVEIFGWLIAGIALGAAYLWLIGQTVTAITQPAAKMTAAGYFVLRLALAAVALWIAAQHGALPLLGMLLGFMIARFAISRRLREAESGK
jgi:hypothetical protein